MFTIGLAMWRPGVTKYGNVGVELLQEARAKNPEGFVFPTEAAASEACKQLYEVLEARWRKLLLSTPNRDPATVKPLGCADIFQPEPYRPRAGLGTLIAATSAICGTMDVPIICGAQDDEE